MSHIFISYSHEDIEQARNLHKALEQAGYKVWRDERDIEYEWPAEITNALNKCSAVVVLLSDHSIGSFYVRCEVVYCSGKKKIIPLAVKRNDGVSFAFDNIMGTDDDTFELLIRTQIQLKYTVEDVLMVLAKLGIEPIYPNNGLSALSVASVSDKTYKIGDIYHDNNGVEIGVVFEITNGGKHGKIVSIAQCDLTWLNNSQDKIDINTAGACDPRDGRHNMDVIRNINGWQNKYPTFAWCARLGDGWYLPAIKEFEIFSKNDGSIRKIVNTTLSELQEHEIDEDEYYWSSTEGGKFTASCFKLGSHSSANKPKDEFHYVRAFLEF